MKRNKAIDTAAVLLCILSSTVTSISAQTVIHQLGRSPVISQPMQSTKELKAHAAQLLAAAKTLHLTQSETDALTDALSAQTLERYNLWGYGVIPRHLDAMASMGPNGYVALHDVTIPADQYGWHLTTTHGDTRTDIYVPNACGNISIVRTQVPPPTAPPATPTPMPTLAPTPAPPPVTPPPPTPEPNKGFWARWGAIVIPIAACGIADLATHKPYCGFGPPAHTNPVHPYIRPTPTPSPTPSCPANAIPRVRVGSPR